MRFRLRFLILVVSLSGVFAGVFSSWMLDHQRDQLALEALRQQANSPREFEVTYRPDPSAVTNPGMMILR